MVKQRGRQSGGYNALLDAVIVGMKEMKRSKGAHNMQQLIREELKTIREDGTKC